MIDSYIKKELHLRNQIEEDMIIDFIRNNLIMLHDTNDLSCSIRYNHPEGTFMWAVEQIKQGKKVTQKSKADWWFCCGNPQMNRTLGPKTPGNGNQVQGELYSQELSLMSFTDTDWEIFEEEKTLKEIIEHIDELLIEKDNEYNITVEFPKKYWDTIKRARELK